MGVDALADPRDRRVDEIGCRPRRLDARDADDEVAQHVLAAGRVDDLRMELDPVQVPVRRLEAGERGRVGLGGRREPFRQPGDRVAVAHPDGLVGLDALEQAVAGRDRDVRRAVLALAGRQDVTTELASHELGAVTDAQDGDASAPDRRIRLRGVVVVDGVGAAAEDDRLRAAAFQFLVRGVVREQLGVDVELADAASDQLGELAAEVEDDDRSGHRGRGAILLVVDGAIGGWCLERGLEIGLDLRVVRGEDAMAGVGRVAVDGLAAVPLPLRG